jgi:hypothetical protein
VHVSAAEESSTLPGTGEEGTAGQDMALTAASQSIAASIGNVLHVITELIIRQAATIIFQISGLGAFLDSCSDLVVAGIRIGRQNEDTAIQHHGIAGSDAAHLQCPAQPLRNDWPASTAAQVQHATSSRQVAT